MAAAVEMRERRAFIRKRLKNGAIPADVIEEVIDKYAVSHDTAYQDVYKINAEINKAVKDLAPQAAEYIVNVMQTAVSKAMDMGDVKGATAAATLLAKVTKCDSPETQVNVNFSFNYGEDD